MLNRLTKSSFGTYVVGAAILAFGAFFNWFPFFTGDTAVYINSGFENYVPGERPVFYGWFLRYSSLGFSLWLPALVQSGMLAYLLILLIRKLMPDLNQWWVLLILVCVGLGTGVWWESTKLIPDVFIAVMTLALLLLSFFKHNARHKTVLVILVWLGAVVHLSHAAVLLLFVLWILVFNPFGLRSKNRMVTLSAVTLLAFASLMLSNLFLEGELTVAKSNKVFVLGKMNEAGLLDLYLDDHCEDQKLALCAYKDSLPATAWQFVWDPNGAVMQLGGWEANEKEHKSIVKGIITSPKYWPHLAYKATMATAVQLSQMQVGDNLFRQEKGSNSIQSIERYYPQEKNAALWTKQFLMELPFAQMSWYYVLMTLLSIGALFYLKATRTMPKKSFQIMLTLSVLLVLNAAVTANLANIASRLNQRLLWVLPALVIVELFRLKLAQKKA